MSAHSGLSKKINRLSQGQRAAVLALGLCALMLPFSALIVPITQAMSQMDQKERAARSEQALLGQQISQINSGKDTKRLQALVVSRTKEIELVIAPLLIEAKKHLLAPSEVAQFLRDMMPVSNGPRLVSVKNSPAVIDTASTGLFRHAFDVEFEGSYQDVIDHMARLYSSGWRLSVGPMVLQGVDDEGRQTARLKLSVRITAFSDQPTWLSVPDQKDGA